MFLNTFEIKIKIIEERETNYGTFRKYTMNKTLNDYRYFWNLEDLPENSKPIIALSNGSKVTCYYTFDDNTVTIYRPNPNSKIYNPLTVDEHITHTKIYGLY